jgi:hypothetical protein
MTSAIFLTKSQLKQCNSRMLREIELQTGGAGGRNMIGSYGKFDVSMVSMIS